LLTHPDPNLLGNKAKVVGYTNDKIKIKITQQLKKMKTEKLYKIVNTD
jgi:hypothetical protein